MQNFSIMILDLAIFDQKLPICYQKLPIFDQPWPMFDQNWLILTFYAQLCPICRAQLCNH